MKLNKTHTSWGVAAATLTIAGALVSPQAAAASKAEHALQATDSKVQALEAQVNQMSQMLQSMQEELTRVRTAASRDASQNTAKVQELDQWMASVKSAPVASESKDNMVFFRGGYAHANRNRGGTVDPTTFGTASNRNGLTVGPIGDQDAWYFGAGFDWSLDDDLFGMMDNTEVIAELMFDYKELGQKANNGLSPAEVGVVNGILNQVNGTAGLTYIPAANTQTATVNQLTLAASPKIKFMKGSKFRPWLIPAGFELNIVSPPSDAITVLAPGMQFGAGADYNIWNNLYVGVDARYHWTPDNVDGVDTDGVTAGGYLGIGF